MIHLNDEFWGVHHGRGCLIEYGEKQKRLQLQSYCKNHKGLTYHFLN